MLPAYPWVTRPEDEPLTIEEVCEALWLAEGDVRAAADRLRVGSLVLRKFIERSTRARAIIREANACLGDEAVRTLRSALRDEDARRQDWAVRFILNAKNSRSLGWSTVDEARAASQQPGPIINVAPIVVTWADGTKIGPPSQSTAPVIDVTPSSNDKRDD